MDNTLDSQIVRFHVHLLGPNNIPHFVSHPALWPIPLLDEPFLQLRRIEFWSSR